MTLFLCTSRTSFSISWATICQVVELGWFSCGGQIQIVSLKQFKYKLFWWPNAEHLLYTCSLFTFEWSCSKVHPWLLVESLQKRDKNKSTFPVYLVRTQWPGVCQNEKAFWTFSKLLNQWLNGPAVKHVQLSNNLWFYSGRSCFQSQSQDNKSLLIV